MRAKKLTIDKLCANSVLFINADASQLEFDESFDDCSKRKIQKIETANKSKNKGAKKQTKNKYRSEGKKETLNQDSG